MAATLVYVKVAYLSYGEYNYKIFTYIPDINVKDGIIRNCPIGTLHHTQVAGDTHALRE